jgi:hypothetical protein
MVEKFMPQKSRLLSELIVREHGASVSAPSGNKTKVVRSVGGTAGADQTYSTFLPALAFNDDTADYWHAGFAQSAIYYDFGSAKQVSGYELCIMDQPHGGALEQAPRVWTFEWLDGATWRVLDTQPNVVGWDWGPAMKDFPLGAPQTAQSFRMNITAANGGNISIAVLHFYDLV